MDSYGITKDSYNKIARAWADKHFPEGKMDDEAIRFIKYITTGKRILDVGCGPGRYVKQFLEHGFEPLGIDFSEKMIEEARKRAPSGEFIVGDMMHLDYETDSADGIWCFGALHHLRKDDVPRVLADFRRILKARGILALSVKAGTGEVMDESEDARRLFAYYSKDEISNLVRNAGFKILDAREKKLSNLWIVVFAEANK